MREMLREDGVRINYRHSVADGELHHQKLVESDSFRLLTQTGVRRKPLRWLAELESDYFFFLGVLKGSIFVRGLNSGRTRALLPRMALIANSGAVLRGLLSRGEHSHLVGVWPAGSTRALHRWWQDLIRAEGNGHDGFITASCHVGTILGEVFDQMMIWSNAYSDRNLPKIQGCLHIIAGEGLTSEEPYRLSAVPRASCPAPLLKLIDEVQRNPGESWTLKDAASYVGYSPFHLSRTFKATIGYGFPEYVERRRTEIAITKMLQSNKDIDTISAESGFSTSQGLREAFRQHLGFLPSEVRAFSAGEEMLAGIPTGI
ncbi:MAG: helix-turn-helix transcriptional regulator [Armatimonadetes bacterium]|nr:helix-turn-helix transcriptional regulator [Armatimonadota bacterium]